MTEDSAIETYTIDTFNYEKEYIKEFNFKNLGSSDIKINLILYAMKHLDRKKSVEKINKFVKYEHISEDIEHSIFEFALLNTTINNFLPHYVVYIYDDKVNDICDNLDLTNERIDNKTLLKSILEMRVNASIVAFLQPEQLHPMRFKDSLAKIALKEETMSSLQTTDSYTCKKCKQKKFKISTMQTRCADEPETKFFTCLVCYNTFTM